MTKKEILKFYKNVAQIAREVHTNLVAKGFTESQSFELTKILYHDVVQNLLDEVSQEDDDEDRCPHGYQDVALCPECEKE